MRIEQLHLLRYGKFTDQALAFPHAGRDFHLVVGANEAGKSTARSAILDLLYGIETRSTFGFLHAKPEMRLGATIEHQGATLEFIRAKARAKSLLGPGDTVLADAALAAFLGGTDRAFFDQMFGLDHERLEAGGNDILSASTDIGQILFQSAAGIVGLGIVRDQLEAEADRLWARRRSGDRTYFIASDALARAEGDLKAATVRTKDWMEARDKVQELEARRELLRGRYRDFEIERNQLERVRRVASAPRQLRERQAELQELAEVILLPEGAAQQLTDTELELAGAQRDQQLYANQAQEAREQLELVCPDERLLKHEADIRELADRRQQLSKHETDIDRRQLEVSTHWEQIAHRVHQLGWPVASTEEDLARELPALPARSAVAGLIKRYDVLDLARKSTSSAVTEKAAELDSLEGQLEGLSVSTVPAALRVALASARALGDLKASTRRDEGLVSKSSRELASAVAALGAWSPDRVALRDMILPSEKDIRLRQKRDTEQEAVRKALADKQRELKASIKAVELEIAQYRRAHRAVSHAELTEVRAERDAVWRTIKSGDKAVDELAADFEAKVTTADNVSDLRHDKAREVSELQSKLDALERLEHQAAELPDSQAANDAERASMGAEWEQLTAALGLAKLPLQDFEGWRVARDKALRAEDVLTDARRELDATQQAAEAAARALGVALESAGISFDREATLDTLVFLAGEAVDGATEAKARLDELTKQRALAAAALGKQKEKADAAQVDFDAWSSGWRAAMAQVALPETLDVASAEDALKVMAEIDEKLRNIREIRKTRIETMQRDLSEFKRDVAVVVTAGAPDVAQENTSVAVTELSARLAKALADKKEADRLRKDVKTNETQAKSAGDRVDRAKARVLPLLLQAQVSSHDELRALIVRSDTRRRVEAAAIAAEKAVAEAGDGLTLEALEAEIAATDATQIPALIADLGRQLEGVRQEQDALMTDLTLATAQLEKIAGQDDAACAESDRQDALAKMANAAERYIKVYTASRLLKWAIERYRETKQGPMLTRAGEIFGALTLGSFQKLTVDFDSDSLELYGLRPGGELVGIAGMSDGTRDQLYLALRLAALELHLGQGHALPFIADDLFINYDDQRAKAGLEALARLSEKTQVIFLSHHDHLVPTVRAVFGGEVNVVGL